MALYDWLHDAYASNLTALEPLVRRFAHQIGSSEEPLDAIVSELDAASPFSQIMDRLVADHIAPAAGRLRFETGGQLHHLDGKTLWEVQAEGELAAHLFSLNNIRNHLMLSVAFLLRDIYVGKPVLFGLELYRRGFSLPCFPCETSGTQIRLEANFDDGLIASPRFECGAGMLETDPVPTSETVLPAGRHQILV